MNDFGMTLLALGIVVLGLAWLLFPLLVLSKFSELIKLAREMSARLASAEQHLRGMRRYYEPQPPPLPTLSEQETPKRETLKLGQFDVPQ